MQIKKIDTSISEAVLVVEHITYDPAVVSLCVTNRNAYIH